MTRIIVRISLLPIADDLHGDYLNDRNFKRRFQLWLNALRGAKDRLLTTLYQAAKKSDSLG